MQRVSIRELSQNTARVLARVRRGETLEVTDRGHPVARLVPVHPGPSTLDRLVADGRAIAPTMSGPIRIPPVLGDTALTAAEELAASGDEQHW